MLKELEQAFHVFLTGTGFGGVALALMSLCRPGDEILVSDNVYGPTKEISEKLLKEFKVMANFYNPDSFEDLKNKVSKKTKKRNVHKLRKKIGVIFQDYKLLQQRTVYENIALPLQLNGIGRKKIKENVSEALELTYLNDFQGKYPYQLSGGEQQRVCIARAIVKNPEIILADEPTGNLDPTAAHKILKILEQINKEGTSVIMATHNYKLIAEKDYRIIELKNGRLISG